MEIVLQSGRHKGKPLTQVPSDYLRWMVGTNHKDSDSAREELERRGGKSPLIVSYHAIDRASLRMLHVFHADAGSNEGLHAWLHRITIEALATQPFTESGGKRHYNYKGMRLVIGFTSHETAVLITVMESREGLHGDLQDRYGADRPSGRV